MDGERTVRLRFTRQYGPYHRGEVALIKGDLADRLVAWGYAAEERQMVIETATAEPEAERADLTPRRRRR